MPSAPRYNYGVMRSLPSPTLDRPPSSRGSPDYTVWGSELSPFALKLRALLDYAELPYAWLPRDGGRLDNYRTILTIARAKRGGTVIRYPRVSELDEYPLVPFLIENGRSVHYDTSALARWLDAQHTPRAGRLFPDEPCLGFIAQLVDEAFDEFGLYMVHHKRWVLSALSNDAGKRLAHEFRRVLWPGMGSAFAQRFARRQVRRLPYLFSVAPHGFTVPGLPRELTPPSRPGFPETHGLLDEAWERYVAGMETVLASQPFLLGERFTAADAAAYGQLGMNLADPAAATCMRACAPVTYAWLGRIRNGEHVGSAGTLRLSDSLGALLTCIVESFVPLMRQNARAYGKARAGGQCLFNESAFNRGCACYDGELMGRPFRSVIKTFQVRVWRELRDAWDKLPEDARARISRMLGDEGVAALASG